MVKMRINIEALTEYIASQMIKEEGYDKYEMKMATAGIYYTLRWIQPLVKINDNT
jgi:hypothetical protein